MKIITISRQFGSGGRELGKRLADELGYDYYDREIIARISESRGLDEDYVERTLRNRSWASFGLHFAHSFVSAPIMDQPHISLLLERRKVVEEIAALGRNCVIVGSDADVILAELDPFTLFVCAPLEDRVERCLQREEQGLSVREIRSNIRQIDANRRKTRQLLSDSPWGEPTSYQMTLNTGGQQIKQMAQSLAAYLKSARGC